MACTTSPLELALQPQAPPYQFGVLDLLVNVEAEQVYHLSEFFLRMWPALAEHCHGPVTV